MPFHHSTIRTAVLLFPLFCGEPILAQDEPPPNGEHSNPVQMGVTGESKHHRCFEQPHGAKDAIHRLPASARNWLAEDAIYIITPEERCAFLHLDTEEEREQFVEQFWYRRSVEPISLDYDFKTEFYRRFVVANEKYRSKLLAGWKTDRGRLYVIFGPPDSVDGNSDAAAPRSIETIGPERPTKIRFKDLEALVVTRMVRNEVKFIHQIEYSPATHATTLARVDIQIPCEKCTRDGQSGVEYPLFVRFSKPSGWVVATSELVADVAMRDKANSKFTLTAHLDVPIAPGTYQLAIATKNATTGDAGVLRTQVNVPTYELLETKN